MDNPRYYVGLDKLALFGEDSHPEDLMNAIDIAISALNNLSIHVRKKNSRVAFKEMWSELFIEWGKWSHNFNKLLRLRIKIISTERDPVLMDLYSRLIYVYVYWWNRHHWLTNIMMKYSKLAGGSKRAGLQKGRKTLTACIKGEFRQNLSPQFRRLIDVFTRKEYRDEFKDILK